MQAVIEESRLTGSSSLGNLLCFYDAPFNLSSLLDNSTSPGYTILGIVKNPACGLQLGRECFKRFITCGITTARVESLTIRFFFEVVLIFLPARPLQSTDPGVLHASWRLWQRTHEWSILPRDSWLFFTHGHRPSNIRQVSWLLIISYPLLQWLLIYILGLQNGLRCHDNVVENRLATQTRLMNRMPLGTSKADDVKWRRWHLRPQALHTDN